MIVGTAGHIDHGKTTLVKALTGVDADRLPEEKARGITLDLGYAYVPTEDGRVLGFVDVPGHEKLIHNMLAGATGIDYLLLVIAADDGPMPQTREHLELAELLGIRRGAVVLSKCDVVAPERADAAAAEARALLAGGTFEEEPLFRVSGHSGEGIAALKAHLADAARSWLPRDDAGGFRLAVDRCFSLAGAGTIVTGTVHAGRVRVGDTVTLSPPGLSARVRSLRAQDRETAEGRAGERCALALAGIERSDVARGMWVVAPGLHQPLQRFQAEIRLPRDARPLAHWAPVHVHLGAADIMGRVALLEGERVEAGQAMLAEILLERASHALRGDRFVLRDASAVRSVAGGRVLDIFPPARHKRSAERLEYLHALADDDPATALGLAAARQIAGVDLSRYAANWNLDHAAESRLWRDADLTVVEGVGFAPGNWQALTERLLAALAAEHERAPDLQGVEHERLRRLTLPALSRGAFNALLDRLLTDGRMARSGAWLHLPGHRVELSAADSELWNTLRPLLEAAPYGPPRVRDVAKAAGVPEDTVRRVLKRVARVGLAYPVAHDHYFTAAAVAELARIVADLDAANGAARAADLRDRIGGGRKVAIHILEFFDRIGYTRRVRDEHMVRRSGAPLAWTQ
jgi:selenocysteine-specific elongation factor